MLENNHDMTQWGKWNNTPLPISADDAWKEMELLLDEDSTDKIPVPFVTPLADEKRNKKRLILWWFILLAIIITSGFWFLNSNKRESVSSISTNKLNISVPLKNKRKKEVSIASKKMIDKINKEIADTKNYKLQDTEHDYKETNSEIVNKVYNFNNNKRGNEKKLVQIEHVDTMNNIATANKSESNKGIKVPPTKSITINNRILKRIEQAQEYSSLNSVRVVSKKSKLNNKIIKDMNKANINSVTNFDEIKLNSKNDISMLTKRSRSNELYNQTIISTNKRESNVSRNKNLNSTKQKNNYPINNTSVTSIDANIISRDSMQKTQTSIIKIDSNLITKQKDTTNVKKDSTVTKRIVLKRLSAGLQWSASLPMIDNNNNTEKQFIPGLWITKEVGNNSSLSLSINPYVMHTNSHFEIENKTVGIGAIASSIKLDTGWYRFDTSTMQFKLDTTIQVNRVATLLQSFGYRIAMNYRYQLTNKWQLSCGMEYNKVVSAYINDKIIRLTDGFVAKDESSDYKKGSDLWNLMQHSYFSGNAAISYSPITKLSIELGFHRSLKSISNDSNNAISPSSYYLNIRWKLWQGDCKL